MVWAFLLSLFLLSAFARQPLQSGLEGEIIRLFVIVFYLTAMTQRKSQGSQSLKNQRLKIRVICVPIHRLLNSS